MKSIRTSLKNLDEIVNFDKMVVRDNYYILSLERKDDSIIWKVLTRDIPGVLSDYKEGMISLKNGYKLSDILKTIIPDFDTNNVFALN